MFLVCFHSVYRGSVRKVRSLHPHYSSLGEVTPTGLSTSRAGRGRAGRPWRGLTEVAGAPRGLRDMLVTRSSAGVGGAGFGEMVVVGVQVAEHSGRFALSLSHALASAPSGGCDMHALHVWAAAVAQPTWAAGSRGHRSRTLERSTKKKEILAGRTTSYFMAGTRGQPLPPPPPPLRAVSFGCQVRAAFIYMQIPAEIPTLASSSSCPARGVAEPRRASGRRGEKGV